MGELGLNEHHQEQIVQFLRFSRYQRGQRLRSVDSCFEEMRKSRLNDSTYTREEVCDLLKSLQDVLRADLESELINTSHTTLLLMRQMCGQAEKWHLKLGADLSELENRELLDAVQQFEEQQFELTASQRPQITVLKKLELIEGAGAAPLLQSEIDRLRSENDTLRSRLQSVERAAIEVASDKKKLNEELEHLKTLQTQVPVSPEANSDVQQDVAQLEAKMEKIKGSLSEELQKSHINQNELETNLQQAYRRLLEVQEQLEMTEKELDKKFSHTNTYKNMKQMLTQKNQQIKQLRTSLAAYEPGVEKE